MQKSRLISVSLSLIIISSLFASFFSGCGEAQTTTPTTTDTLTSTPAGSLKELVYQGMYTYEDFNTPDTCGSCHTGIYSDWSNSLMGTNYVTQWKQVEYFQLAYAQSQQVAEVAGVASGCIQCHAPLAFLSDDIPPAEASKGTRANESVSCEICHSLTGSSEEQPFNFSAIMALGNTKYGPRYDSESPYHATEFSYFIGSPEHCALCHDEQSPYGAWVKETYREWSAGPFAKQNITCIECHMDTAAGIAAIGGKERDDIAQHTFMAVHTPERLADNIIISPSDRKST
ncbi:MAG: multiheme c-type cytochrome, partial [Dehalococcoidales bacterium]|nr:multiheme c-type cytochrome [Dehalococcoidales bacterium]